MAELLTGDYDADRLPEGKLNSTFKKFPILFFSRWDCLIEVLNP